MVNTPNHIRFNTGGAIKAGNLAIGTVSVTTHMNNMTSSLKKMNVQMQKFQGLDFCNHRRGGPRSKIYCEVPKTVPHEIHTGRSHGRWFSWKEKSWDG